LAKHTDAITQKNNPGMMKVFAGLFIKITLVILSVVITSLIIPTFFLLNQTVTPPLINITTIAVIGFISGLSARLLLRQNTGLLRALSVLISLFISLAYLNYITNGYLGLKPLDFNRSTPDWADLGQIALGAMIAWLVLHAWKSPAHTKKIDSSIPVKLTAPPAPRSTTQAKASVLSQRASLPPFFYQPFWQSQWSSFHSSCQQLGKKILAIFPHPKHAQSKNPNSRAKTSRASKTASLQAQKRRQPINTIARSSRRRKPHVQLVGEEEHRCPYCLEIMKPKRSGRLPNLSYLSSCGLLGDNRHMPGASSA
jgi:hypothetical protein